MAFYVVVHHRRDPYQPWANTWLDDDRLKVISTTAEIAARCDQAQRSNEQVFVHRCAWLGGPAVVCCSVAVKAARYDEKLGWVEFADSKVLGHSPRHQPGRGENSYDADPPTSTAAHSSAPG